MGVESTPSARPVGDGCPTDDVLAAHLAGELVGEEAERIATHLDGCDSCRELVVAFSRGMRTERDIHAPARGPFPTPSPLASIDLTPPSLPGAFAGRYQLKRLIGSGGMGEVYEALDLNLHRLIALKVLRLAPDKPTELAEAANRLVREARAMAVLSHRNVVAVYDVGQHKDQVFVAMQLIDGSTLRLWLASHKRSARQILRVLHDAGVGLAAAHASRVIHRDFKPDNILISRRGTARVTDFGLARRADLGPDPLYGSTDAERGSRPKFVEIDGVDQDNVTRTGAVVGTPAYMAPEQAQGQTTDARADQFSFCVTAWEALYGQRPFAGTTWSEIYANVINGNLTAAAPERSVPWRVQRALRRGLSANPADRFESMPDLLAVLDEEIRRPIRRQRVIMVAAIAVAASAIAILVFNQSRAALREEPAPDPQAAPPTLTVEPIGAGLVDPAAAAPTAQVQPPPELVGRGPAPSPPDASAAVTAAALVTHHHDRSDPKPHGAAPIADPAPRGGDEATGSASGAGVAAPEPRLDALVGERKALAARWKQRALLAGDLPAAYTDAVREADAALAAGDASRAEAELGHARAAIDGVVIDLGFVNRKLNRLNDRITALPAEQRDEYAALLEALSASVKRADYAAANRKLNEIAARLRLEN